MHPSRPLLVLSLLCAAAAPLAAQDSVAKTNCLPGDAVSPWANKSTAGGSEQRNNYVVDLVPFSTSWKTTFGIGPVAKSSKIQKTFFNALIGAQAISRTQKRNVTILERYMAWNKPGQGVNNDKTLNDPGTTIFGVPNGNQLAFAFAESGATDVMNVNHGGIVTGIVKYEPIHPGRLYVQRIVAATAGCDNGSQLASFGFGAVDREGNTIFRVDGFGASGAGCPGLTPIGGNNVFLTAAGGRNGDKLNVINGAFPTGGDATTWILQKSQTTHNTPSLADVGGPFYIGSNFLKQYVRGKSNPPKADTTHLAAGVTDHRGGMSYLHQNHPALSSVRGVAAVLGRNAAGQTVAMNVFGLDAKGDPTKALGLIPPKDVTDPITGEKNIAGANEFDHYHSQVAFRGGNGQIAMNVDGQGNLLVAAVMDHPSDGGPAWNQHFIPVAKVTPKGVVSWSMAAYNSSRSGKAKPILDGPGGKAIGRLTTLDKVTGGTPAGPSFSAPMIDSAGNVWFLSAIELFGPPQRFTTGLIRAVYAPAKFGWELELVLANGQVFKGANSATNYQIRFLPIADSNSISSATAFSQNIVEQGHGGFEHPTTPTRDSVHLGGLVLHASIIYDKNGDGKFVRCSGPGGNRQSPDQDYEVVLYLGSLRDCQLDLGFQGPGTSELSMCGQGLKLGETSSIVLHGAPAGQPTAFLISTPGGANLPFGGGTVVSFSNNLAAIPLTTSANGTVTIPVNGTPNAVALVLQFVTLDLSLPQNWSISNAVLARFGQ